MPLLIENPYSDEARTEQTGDGSNPGVAVQMVYGPSASMMVTTRPPGYHSLPHRHDREQYNYVVSGESWLFVGEQALYCRPGSFSRVPANAVHWTWNRSAEPTMWVEVHIPGAQGTNHLNGRASPIFDETEDGVTVPTPPQTYVDPKDCRMEEIEIAALGNTKT